MIMLGGMRTKVEFKTPEVQMLDRVGIQSSDMHAAGTWIGFCCYR